MQPRNELLNNPHGHGLAAVRMAVGFATGGAAIGVTAPGWCCSFVSAHPSQ